MERVSTSSSQDVASGPPAARRPRRASRHAAWPGACSCGEAARGALPLLLLALLAHAASAADECYVDLAVAAGAKACVGGTFQYIEPPVTYPVAPLFCNAPFTGGNPSPLTGSVRVIFPAVNGSCSFDSSTVLKKKNKALTAAVAAAYINSSTPLTVSTIQNSFSNPRYAYAVNYTAANVQLSLESTAVGGKLNAKKSVNNLRVKLPSGVLNVTLQATVGGVTENETFNADIAQELADGGNMPNGAQLTGCKLQLRTATREWYLDCPKAKAKLPEFKIYPKAPFFMGKWVLINLEVQVLKLTASAPLASAQPVV